MGNSVDELLDQPFCTRPYEDQVKVVQEGKPCPPLPHLLSRHKDKKCEYTRHFSTSQYQTVEWMTGCEKRARLFCWPCLLFSKDKGVWNKLGFADLNHLTTAQQKHERAQLHVQAFLNLRMFEKRGLESSENHRQNDVRRHNEQVKRNRDVLKRIIDVICYLAREELPLECLGQSGSNAGMSNGYLMGFFSVLRDYDPLLDAHLNSSAVVFQGSSQGLPPVVIVNVIRAMANVLKDCIKKEINSATFVSIILDETSEIVSRSQLSTVLRFVLKGKVHERFVGFKDISTDRTYDGLFNHVVNTVGEFQIEGKLVGHSYDGGCVMTGHASELQRKISKVYPLALSTHCYAHVLTPVLQQSLSLHVRKCHTFFQTMSQVATYFSKLERLQALEEFMSHTLPSLEPVKWDFTCTFSLTNTIKKYRSQFIEFFEDVIEHSQDWDAESIVKARGFQAFLEDFRTVLSLRIFSKMFVYTETLEHELQGDVLQCCERIGDVTQQLQYDREHGFEELWNSAVSEETDVDIDDHKPKRLKRSFLVDDGEEESAYVHEYYAIVDNIRTQIDTRYASLAKLEFFGLLAHERYGDYGNNFPEHLIGKLKDCYGFFDFTRLKNELTVLYSSPEFADKSVDELVRFIADHNLQCGFRDVFRLAQLILTLPCHHDPALIEPALSAMARIRTPYYRDAQEDLLLGSPELNEGLHELSEGLHELRFLAVERFLLSELKQRGSFYDDVISELLLLLPKDRRKELLTYK